MTDHSIAQILRNAGARVEKGWCQGSLRHTLANQESFCSVGALLTEIHGDVWLPARFTDPQYVAALKYLAEAMSEQYAAAIPLTYINPQNHESIVVVTNDKVLTSGREAAVCFEKAAAKAEEHG